MTHLVSYDIADDSLRIKVSKLLIQLGLHRVQYSVFMGQLKTSNRGKLERSLKKIAQSPKWSDEDSVMMLPLHQYSSDFVKFIGDTPDHWLEIQGKLHTLIL